MRPLFSIAAALLLLLLTAGCWDNHELDEYGYVQAVAIDHGEDGLLQLTTLFYNPSSKMGMGEEVKAAQKGINISTSGKTLFEAIRDVPMKFGRKAKWDHMRVILIGEQLARSQNIREILDYFSRDHEPRGTVLPLIAEGRAGDYLKIPPYIEQTVGQQYKKMETNGSLYSAKTTSIPLYELAIHLKSPSRASDIPFIHKSDSGRTATISKIAMVKDSKLVTVLGEKDSEAYLMLTDRYKSGIVEFPCLGAAKAEINDKESVEVISLVSTIVPHIEDDEVTVDIDVRIKAMIGELRCSHLKSAADTRKFESRIAERVEERMAHALSQLQRNQVDVIGIGNRLYRKSPKLWKRLEPSWDELFARSRFRIKVQVEVISTGMNVGTPFGQKED